MQVSSGRHVAPSAPAPTLQLQGPCIDIGCILNFWWNFPMVCPESFLKFYLSAHGAPGDQIAGSRVLPCVQPQA